MRRSVRHVLLLLIIAACFAGARARAEALRFDCGTTDSPVADSYQRLTAEDAYSKPKGYGWESTGQQSVVFGPVIPPDPRKLNWEPAYIDENKNDLNRDGVVSTGDLIFRADVPNGTYRASLLIGDMSQAIGSIDVTVNGTLVASNVAAWTPGVYRQLIRTPIGWWTNVRATVDVKDGSLRVTLAKNQTYYDKQMAEQMKLVNPLRVWGWQVPEKDPPYSYIGMPFVHNSIMAIEVAPYVPPPVLGKNDRLSLSREIASPGLAAAIERFNSRDFPGARKALESVKAPQAQAAKAVVQLWLAGRPEVEAERELVPAALATLRAYVARHPEENCVAELLEDAEAFQRALQIHLTRAKIQIVNGRAVQKNHFIENDKAIGWWWLINESSPLYYKSQLYIARAAHMLLPYIPVLGPERAIFEHLEKKFPDNRYVKYLLHWEWEPYGDGTHFFDWRIGDYFSKSKGAPEWVRQLHAAWGLSLEWADWWVRFKQYPEGNIGGGFGDDVELVADIGHMGLVTTDASELTRPGMVKFCEGLWNLSEINPELGFCLPMADAEHSAEWTGDTLDTMLQVDYGNPTWIERSMKTGKLLRDLWTEDDDHGHRHFRANFFGATQVGTGDQMNDSWINYRAIAPARAVLSYNQSPAIAKLFEELADGWVAAAMSTDRGKPEGVIPAQVSFPDGILGGTNSPNWYTASHPQGTVNYDWAGTDGQRYKFYLHSLLIAAYEQTHDGKYLEPLKLEYELAARYGRAPQPSGGGWLESIRPEVTFGSSMIFDRFPMLSKTTEAKEEKPAAAQPSAASASQAEPGSEAWVAANLKNVDQWFEAKPILEGREGKLQSQLSTQDIFRYSFYAYQILKMRWPLMTTEASATDRVAVWGSINPYLIYTGANNTERAALVTYENTTKDFAAAVLAADEQGFRIIYYSLAPDTREIGILPWAIKPGARYSLTYGPDDNGDEAMDSVLEHREFDFPQHGTPIKLSVSPRVTYIIDVDRVQRGKGAQLAPDPGISGDDIRYDETYNLLMARVHNVGAMPVRNVEVAFYDGDPKAGGTSIGSSVIPNIEAPNDLEPKTVTIGINWTPTKELHDIYVVVDPEDEIKDEITTFNNVAHAKLPREEMGAKPKIQVGGGSSRRGR